MHKSAQLLHNSYCLNSARPAGVCNRHQAAHFFTVQHLSSRFEEEPVNLFTQFFFLISSLSSHSILKPPSTAAASAEIVLTPPPHHPSVQTIYSCFTCHLGHHYFTSTYIPPQFVIMSSTRRITKVCPPTHRHSCIVSGCLCNHMPPPSPTLCWPLPRHHLACSLA